MGTIKEEGAWVARVTTLHVKERLEGMEASVGLHSTYGHEDSVLVDISNADAAYKVQGLVEGAVLVTPTLMVARSAASEAQWKKLVEEIFVDNDNAYVEKVRYIPSMGGGLMAVVPALQEQRDLKR